jgi:hypothetical protein
MGGQSSANWMPSPRDSEIYPVLSSWVAWATDQSPAFDFIPATDPNSSIYPFYVQLVNDLNNVVSSTWTVEKINSQIKMMLWDASTYGIGIMKTLWDNQLSDGYGNAKSIRVDPYLFYPDPQASSFDDAEYFVEAREMSYDEIERRYPTAYKLLDYPISGGEDAIDTRPTLFSEVSRTPKANPGNIPGSGTFGSLGPGIFGRFGTSRSQQNVEQLPSYKVYEFWLKENTEWEDDYPELDPEDRPAIADRHVKTEWRVIVLCKGIILLDEMASDLWTHASHPYDRYVIDDIGEMYGIALVDHLAYPQIYLNRLLASAQHNTELTGNPVLIEAANSGTDRVLITNRPGARIPVKGAAGMNNAPQWLTPPSIPSIVMELINFYISRIENTSGLNELQKGKAPNQRNASDVINMVQEAAFVRIRSSLHNLEDTIQGIAFKLADLISDNYDENRTMAIVGRDGQTTSMALIANHFLVPSPQGASPLKYAINVEAGSTTSTSREARETQALKLSGQGLVDDQYVLESHRIRNIPQLLSRLYQKRQAGLIGTGAGSRQRAARQPR